MAQFRVNILGCGSATPSLRHLPSCQVIDFRDNLMMIDCGEGAQLSMRRMGLKFSRLSHIFISHLHGDHCLGLPGLLSTMALHGKTGTVTVHVFEEGARLFQSVMDMFCREHDYELKFNIVDPAGGLVFENDALSVEAFPLYHRVPCVGYIFREKPKLRHLKGDMVRFYEIPVSRLAGIKNGEDYVTPEGIIIPNDRLTSAADPSVSYAYCSDTAYDSRVAQAVSGIDTLYHEATYIEADVAKAHSRGHATAAEAARTAAEAGAHRLILGHYSKSYHDEKAHLAEAQAIFPETVTATEGMKIDLI